MQFLENIKIKIGKYLLKSSLEKREPMNAVPNFDSIKEIAILYQADDTKKEAEVNKLAQHLREQGKKVLLMGFVNQKQLPENYKFQISQEYFWKESLSLFLLPQKEKVANFINKPFDLLINLYSEFSLPMVAVSAYSKAKNRIGAHFPESESYNDILIDGQFKNLFELGLQMEHYLKIVNSKS